MSAFSVYLFVRTGPEYDSGAAHRRLQALQALRDELVGLGVRVSPVPDQADLDVEITNVFGSSEESMYGEPRRLVRGGDGRRVVIVRISVGDERLDFVCSDGVGRVSAEHHAAKRILVWLESLSQESHQDAGEWRDLTAEICSNS
jgi:hypothetical protein